ncbi:hypothetical protein VUR80DRAFT_1225 [Thermomyces stellatus]
MDHDPRLTLLSPLPTLNIPTHRSSRASRSQVRQSRPTKPSRTLDPEDLSARLANVIAEREAAEASDQSGRSQSIDTKASDRLLSSKSTERHSTYLDPADAQKRRLSSSRSRANSFHGPTGLEYSMLQRAHGRGFELDDRRNCPLLPDPVPSLASIVSYGHRSGAGATARHAPCIPSSRRPSDAGYVPQVTAPRHASTTSSSVSGDPAEREASRRAFVNSPRHSEPASPSGRRRSTKASQGLREGMHEPTIFESVSTDAKPGDRRSMFERVSDKLAQAEGRPRRMTAGDVFKTGETDDGAVASGGRGSADTSHYELVNDRRATWAQADEETRMPRSKRFLRKADSILRKRRGSSARSREGYESSNGSMVDGQEGNHALKSPRSVSSPNSPKSPKSFRSFWPFKKQMAVESH